MARHYLDCREEKMDRSGSEVVRVWGWGVGGGESEEWSRVCLVNVCQEWEMTGKDGIMKERMYD